MWVWVQKTLSGLAVAAIVHAAFIGATTAVHLVHHDHGAILDDQHAAFELILHGHHHDRGTPKHQHPLVTTRPLAQCRERSALPVPQYVASEATLPSTLMVPRQFRREPELCGPGPPSLTHTFVVLRI